MIKFFRRIRQRLLSENRFSKYLLYAIGEIVLVMIGILLALQVNNWNENRKNRRYEREILSIISQNLKNDSIALSNELNKSKESNWLTDRLLKQVDRGNYADSLNNWLGKIISFERFKSQSSAFEVLKSKGIDIVTDKNLRLALISYYDERVPNVYEVLNDVEESFKKDWEPMIREEFLDYKWREYAIPVDPEALFKKQSTISFLKLYRENRFSSEPYIYGALEKISEINELSKDYLND